MRSRVVVSEAMRWPRMAWLARTARCAARRWTPLGAVGRADQDAEPGRIDEADLVQVGHERPAAGRQLEQLFPQPGHGDHVNLPDDGHDGVVPFMPGLNGQCLTHGQLPARPESVLGGPGTADVDARSGFGVDEHGGVAAAAAQREVDAQDPRHCQRGSGNAAEPFDPQTYRAVCGPTGVEPRVDDAVVDEHDVAGAQDVGSFVVNVRGRTENDARPFVAVTFAFPLVASSRCGHLLCCSISSLISCPQAASGLTR